MREKTVQQIIPVEEGRAAVGGDEDIQVAVVIEIRVGGGAPDLGVGKSAANLVGHVVENTRAIVEEQLRRLGVRGIGGFQHHVVNVTVDHQQIEITIQIGVKEETAKTERLACNAPEVAGGGKVDERASASALIQGEHLADRG